MAFKIPTAETVSGPASLRPTGNFSAPDPSGLIQGLSAVDQGLSRAGAGLQQWADRDQQRKTLAEVSDAEATWLKGSLDLGNTFSTDNDWRSFGQRSEQDTTELKAAAAEKISDPNARSKWLDDVELRRLNLVDSIGDRGRSLEQGEYRQTLDTSIAASTDLITDPYMSEPVRARARKNIEATISTAEGLGMVTKAEGAKMREDYLRGSERTLAGNRAEVDLRFRPDYVRSNLGISPGMGGGDIASAIARGTNGAPLVLDPALAGDIGKQLGDAALPDDPKLRAAYLSDPEVNAKYAAAAVDMLTDQYKGDITAAVIAVAPGGGEAMADAWVQSGHDESKLPPKVREFYRSAIDGMKPAIETVKLPTIAAPGVDLERVDVAALERWEATQSAFGQQLTVISGARSDEHNKAVGGASQSRHVGGRDALDISTKGLSKEDTLRLIRTASAQGFTGIGVYDNSIHLDTGQKRAWGASYHNESVPAWARETIDEHLAGKIEEVPVAATGVAPEYQALTFSDRLKLYDAAKVANDQQSLDMKAGIDVAVQNAPSAIMNTGSYDKSMPTASDFVAAYGAADGIEKYKKFDASVDVANKAYGMRTMSSGDIAALVEASVPSSSGEMAGVEQQSFETLSAAAQSILKAREDDPAGYAMQTFPAVADAWAAAGESKDPEQFQQAIARMALAQDVLGISEPKLLPKEIAKQAADTYNNAELTQGERMGALVSTAFATGEADQQEALYKQLVGAGVPPTTQGAMAALARGDTAAAEYLFKAAMFDPEKFPGKISETDANVRQRITEKLLDEGQIGDVIYGLSDGTAENYQRLENDGALMLNAVKLRLVDGSSANLDDAIEKTSRDMYGDVKVVTGKPMGGGAGVKIVMPKDEDAGAMLDGFNALLPTVGDAILADLTPAMAASLPNRQPSAVPSGTFAGMVEGGNIDLNARPTVKNADGTISTVRSMSFEEDGVEVLVPTVSPDGKLLSDDDAIKLYRDTGDFLGKFSSAAEADTYANALHDAQDRHYSWKNPNADGQAAIMSTARDQRVSALLENGYFTAQGDDGYVFVDPYTGQAVPSPDGDGPMLFSRDAVVEAAAGSRARQQVNDAQQNAQPGFGAGAPGGAGPTDPYWGF